MPETLSVEIGANWDEVDAVRDRSADFLQQLGLTPHAVDALTMITCELAENAVKYSSAEGARGILITLSQSPGAVTVEVRSPVSGAANATLAKLEAAIQWIRGYQDPFEAYVERLQHASAQQMTSTESGLGLVRIAYEGRSILDFYVDEENMVSVSAVYPLEHGDLR